MAVLLGCEVVGHCGRCRGCCVSRGCEAVGLLGGHIEGRSRGIGVGDRAARNSLPELELVVLTRNFGCQI